MQRRTLLFLATSLCACARLGDRQGVVYELHEYVMLPRPGDTGGHYKVSLSYLPWHHRVPSSTWPTVLTGNCHRLHGYGSFNVALDDSCSTAQRMNWSFYSSARCRGNPSKAYQGVLTSASCAGERCFQDNTSGLIAMNCT